MVQLLHQFIISIVLSTLQQHLLELKSKVKHWPTINQSAKNTVVRSYNHLFSILRVYMFVAI